MLVIQCEEDLYKYNGGGTFSWSDRVELQLRRQAQLADWMLWIKEWKEATNRSRPAGTRSQVQSEFSEVAAVRPAKLGDGSALEAYVAQRMNNQLFTQLRLG